jgi:hypothetical protein
MKEVVIK